MIFLQKLSLIIYKYNIYYCWRSVSSSPWPFVWFSPPKIMQMWCCDKTRLSRSWVIQGTKKAKIHYLWKIFENRHSDKTTMFAVHHEPLILSSPSAASLSPSPAGASYPQSCRLRHCWGLDPSREPWCSAFEVRHCRESTLPGKKSQWSWMIN